MDDGPTDDGGAARQAVTPIASDCVVLGIRRWKRWQVEPFLRPRCERLRYAADGDAALALQRRHGGAIVVWAAREPADLAARAAAQGAALWRMEDGFLRSTGLGSNHVGGASLVLDALGIHFDPQRASTLECRLQAGGFTPTGLARAAALRTRLVALGLTKYNVGAREAPRLGGGAGHRRILVPGQVEDDASVRRGAGAAVRDNRGLLRAVRAAEPQAWIVYKPHPDVEAGTRAGRIDDAEALLHADQIVRDVATTALFPQLDAVHTLTSLTGFEALLRGLPVTCWGAPFYAGWGLTEDRGDVPLPRRTRRLALDELVAAALVDYPRYVDLRSGQACTVEQVVEQLAATPPSRAAVEASRLRRHWQAARGLWRSLRPDGPARG